MDRIDEVVEKIKRCVRLARKTGEAGEREAAMNAAKRLAAANGLSVQEIEDEADADLAVMANDDGRHRTPGSELGHCCFILERHFGVICMVRRPASRKWTCSYSWFGSRLNIDIARHVQHILMRESARAWRDASREDNGLKRSEFMRGFFWQINLKLTENPIRNDAQVKADYAAANRKFLDYKRENEVDERKGRQGQLDANSVLKGMDAAKGVSLNRPCGDGGYRKREEVGMTLAIGMK